MKRGIILSVIACMALVLGACAGDDGGAVPRTQVMSATDTVEVEPGDSFRTAVIIAIPDGFYIKADSLRVQTPQLMGVVFGEVVPPPPTTMLEVRGHTSPVYSGELSIPVTGRVTAGSPWGTRKVKLTVRHQGCSKTLCISLWVVQ